MKEELLQCSCIRELNWQLSVETFREKNDHLNTILRECELSLKHGLNIKTFISSAHSSSETDIGRLKFFLFDPPSMFY